MSILIVGGSGYLGQFLVDAFSSDADAKWNVFYTHHQSSPPPFRHPTTPFKVDISTGQGLDECLSQIPPPLVAVINTVAISQPIACERDPDKATAVNVPSILLSKLTTTSTTTSQPLTYIHISTDQVYDGTLKSYWKESDPTTPVNAYGRTKLAAEHEIQRLLPPPHRHVLLRSSIIYGPPPPAAPVNRSLFLQFIDSVLSTATPTTFFEDECRSPVFVDDIVDVCRRLITTTIAGGGGGSTDSSGNESISGVFNMGGPERLSRVDMAKQVGTVRGYGWDCILPVKSASVSRGVASPPDISMDSGKLEQALGMKFTGFTDALQKIFPSSMPASDSTNTK